MTELIGMPDHKPEAGAVKKRERRSVPWEERCDAKTDKRGPDDCWNWQGCISGGGYGYLWVDGKAQRVTRLVLERRIGRRLKKDEHAQHLCNNRKCCNPKHLIVGTHKENMEYRNKCGRQARGEKQGSAKLTDAGAKEVIRLLAEGLPTQKQIAQQMEVASSTVSEINIGHLWRHISPEIPRPIRRRRVA